MKGKVFKPSFPNHLDNYKFKPYQIVYIPVLYTDGVDGETLDVICTQAYEVEEDCYTHFWFSKPTLRGKDDTVDISEWTVADFLNIRCTEGGMNPFDTLNILRTKEKFIEHHK